MLFDISLYLVTCGVTVTIPSTSLEITLFVSVTSKSYTYLPAVIDEVLAAFMDKLTMPVLPNPTVNVW